MPILLLADESITVQRVIALTFAEQDIQVVSVPDGRQAMEKMAAQKPDIVLAGTSLPHVSGYDLAQFMRSKPDLQDVPVLLLSGAFELVDDARLMASGANGVLEKPVEPTVVIGRVKELLGLKSDEKPVVAPGRTITPAAPPQDRKAAPPAAAPAAPATKAAPSNWEQLRDQTGLDRNTKSVEDTAGRGDYLDTLDAAFDTLDQHLSGRVPAAPKVPRNPSGPLGPAGSSADSRSANPPALDAPAAARNPVYEVDDDWFADGDSAARADAKAGRREISEELRDANLVPPAAPTAVPPVFEVDEEWFADDDKARTAKAAEQKQLAAEMGVNDIGFAGATETPAASADVNFVFDDLKAIEVKAEALPATPIAIAPLPPPVVIPPPPLASVPVVAPIERPPAEIKLVTPEITAEMLDQIAARVADRLSAGAFGEQLRHALGATLRDSVKETVAASVTPVVSETAERVVREVVTQAVDGVVRDVVSQTAERVVREVVPQVAERAVRDAVTQTAERAVPEAVSHATDRVVREVVPQATERAVREVVPEAAERVVREVVSQTADRAIREVVSETSERLVRDEIERIKSKSRS